MQGLAETQHPFAATLFDPAAPVPAPIRTARPHRATSGFAVYRNDVAVGLINALAARFPVVRRLMGEDTFPAVARRYATAEPPRPPIMLHYGETFPRFIRGCGPGASIDYLADVAELELARGRAYHAADADPIDARSFAAVSSTDLLNLKLSLHPSVTLLQSRFPIVTIWEANQDDGDNEIFRWSAESALVARPFLEVEVWRLPPGGHTFLAALRGGKTIAAAVASGLEAAPEFDLAANLVVLMGANIVVGFGTDAPL